MWMGIGLFQEEKQKEVRRWRSQREPQASSGQSARLSQKADDWEVRLREAPLPVRGPCWALCRMGSSHQAGGGPRGGACCPGPPCPALLPPHTYLSTSIFRPSTIVPFSFSRARSASELVSKVTNPKPCEQRRDRQEKTG